ncbi:NAD-dependent epimerase/dehydratase family protein [Patescibacteria group bacterium]|nr:NAD-dependent epimerase/dehydratase family protein [Patescibacteria group bacterium]
MKILITGGAGFIGSNLISKLLKQSYEIVVIDDLSTGKKENLTAYLPKIEFIEGSILDKEKLERLFADYSLDLIIHLAAKAGVRASLENPTIFNEVNVLGTLNLLELSKKYKIKKFIFTSSSSVYGNNKKIPFSENDKIEMPISPYAASKRAGELYCFTYSHLFELNVTILRLFTVFGPNNRRDMAHFLMTDSIFKGKPIKKFGDGTTSRDYTYIDDITEGFLKCLGKNFKFEIFNLGNSHTISLNQLIETLENTIEKKAVIENLPLQAGDVQQTFADISKAKKLLDWQPKTSYQQGVKKLIEWYKKTF